MSYGITVPENQFLKTSVFGSPLKFYIVFNRTGDDESVFHSPMSQQWHVF